MEICFLCQRPVPAHFLATHLSLHDDGPSSSIPAGSQTFDDSPAIGSSGLEAILEGMRRAADRRSPSAEFGLFLEEGKLHPIFSFGAETAKGTVWTADLRLRLSDQDEDDPTIRLVTNIPPGSAADMGMLPKLARIVPVLKSMLQKAVRRQEGGRAKGLAALMLRVSADDLLRRLPIIMIEDATLHPALPVLVWLTAASSKGYLPSAAMRSTVLAVVAELARCKYRDAVPSTSAPLPQVRFRDLEDCSDGAARTLIASLLVRASYGGTSGDLAMLRSMCGLWRSRLTGMDTAPQLSYPSTSPHPYLAGSFVADLEASPWSAAVLACHYMVGDESEGKGSVGNGVESCLLKEGIDFHCDGNLLRHVSRHLSEHHDSEEVKEAIWLFRSSVNHRPPLPAASVRETIDAQRRADVTAKFRLRRLWARICPAVEEYSRRKVDELAALVRDAEASSRNDVP